ncbi:recombinase family protein [Streptomyces sp. NPDC059597]|uniref:recombinase family protein n=1 Tax=Streptomyces sp. NPDC059597 TaxID=3346879 RepID=UPI00369A7DBF
MPYAPEYLHLVIPGVTFEGLLYGRSSEDAVGEGESVEDQLASLRADCGRHKWTPVRELKDVDASASRHGRRKLRDDFEALIDAITYDAPPAGVRRIAMAFEASRFYRELDAYVRLRDACVATNTLLYYGGQVYDLSRRDDRKLTAQHAVDAEDEGEGIHGRNVRTANSQADAGMPHGKSLYGYTRIYRMVKGRRRCVGQEEDERGAYVVEMIRRLDAGHSLRAVNRWISAEPAAARPDGAEWTVLHVRRQVLNRAYLGERQHNGGYTKAVWEPLKGLDTPEGRAMFNRVTAKLRDPSRNQQRGTSPRHLMTYIALCGECGDHAVLKYISQTKNRKANLTCLERTDTSINEEMLDGYVEEAVITWFSNKREARAALVPKDEKVKEMVASTQKLINGYEEQLAEARRLAVEFDDETGRFRLPAATLAAMESKLEPKLEAARKKLQSFAGVSPLLLQLLEADDPDTVWNGRPGTDDQPAKPGLTIDQKRQVVREVVTVRLHKAQRPGTRTLEPARIRLSFVGQPGFRAQPLRAPEPARPAAETE